MDQLKKLFKKNSLVEKEKARRKALQRSRSLPLDHDVEEEPRKPVYRGRGPLRASKIQYVESEDRSLPNAYEGMPVLDITQISCDEVAKEWLSRKNLECGRRIHQESQRPPITTPPSQRQRRLLNPKPSFQEFTRMAKEDFSQLFATDDSSSSASSSSRTYADEESMYEDNLQINLRTRYNRAYGPREPLPASVSTTHLKPRAQVMKGPVLHHTEIQEVKRQPSQISRRGETGVVTSTVTRTDNRNKPLPRLPAGALDGRVQRTTAPRRPTQHHRATEGPKALQLPSECPPGWF